MDRHRLLRPTPHSPRHSCNFARTNIFFLKSNDLHSDNRITWCLQQLERAAPTLTGYCDHDSCPDHRSSRLAASPPREEPARVAPFHHDTARPERLSQAGRLCRSGVHGGGGLHGSGQLGDRPRWRVEVRLHPAFRRPHQPMRWRNCRIEQRIRFPHVIHIIDAERCMFDQMCSLVINLKRVITVEEINVEQFAIHNRSVIQTIPYEYETKPRECRIHGADAFIRCGSTPFTKRAELPRQFANRRQQPHRDGSQAENASSILVARSSSEPFLPIGICTSRWCSRSAAKLTTSRRLV